MNDRHQTPPTKPESDQPPRATMRALSGKVAVVTGGGRGLGRRYCLELAAAGAHVIVNDLGVTIAGNNDTASPADEVAAEINASGGKAVANHGDVADPDGAASICSDAVAAFGRVDILVNNAGNVRDVPFTEMSIDDFDSVLGVHLRGTFLVSQPVFRHMVERGGGGVIVNTTSRSGIRGKTHQANYGAAKAGIIGLSSVMALEGAAHGIRVWTLSPRFASRTWHAGAVTSSGPVTDELRDRYTSDAAAATLLFMVGDKSVDHTGKVMFASADSVHELRWEAAKGLRPGAFPQLPDEIAAAVADGNVLFSSPSSVTQPG